MATFIILILCLGLAVAQSSDIDRNCTANDIEARPGQVSYRTLNATGTFDFKGFGDINSGTPLTTWTWSTGVQNVWNFTNNLTFWYQQPVWLDTHGTDLASDDLDYEMCYLTLSKYSSSAQRRGQGDSGDCTKFFNQKCVDDWRRALSDQGLLHMRSNSTDRQAPCEALRQFMPESCKDFKEASRAWGCKSPHLFISHH